MPAVNPIRRGRNPRAGFSVDLATGKSRAVRGWFAVCPHCGDTIRWRGYWPGSGSTRKNTKDALHRHLRERHG